MKINKALLFILIASTISKGICAAEVLTVAAGKTNYDLRIEIINSDQQALNKIPLNNTKNNQQTPQKPNKGASYKLNRLTQFNFKSILTLKLYQYPTENNNSLKGL